MNGTFHGTGQFHLSGSFILSQHRGLHVKKLHPRVGGTETFGFGFGDGRIENIINESFILEQIDPSDPKLLRALLERGIPATMRKRLESSTLSVEARRLYARALVELGQRYWRSADFAQAASVSQLGSDGKGEYAEETRLLAALAAALQGGPRDAAEMMLRGPFLPAGVGNVSGLDTIARSKSPFAGMAAFDAAFILQLVPPVDPDPAFWDDLGKRYERAAKLLTDADRKARAQEQAAAARDTAQALREK